MNASQCCESVRQGFATMHGICWIYQDETHIVSSPGIENEFKITFRVRFSNLKGESVAMR